MELELGWQGQTDRVLRALGSHRGFWSKGSKGSLEHSKDLLGCPVDIEDKPTFFR